MKQIHILEDPVRKVFFSYLIPSVSATLVTSIYILADTVMIGRGIGAVGIAALNILLPLYNTFFGVGMMCGVGGSVLFGVRKGQGNLREAREYFTMGLLMMLFISILASIFPSAFIVPWNDTLHGGIYRSLCKNISDGGSGVCPVELPSGICEK